MIPSKVCESCGRSFEYRKKWEKNWDSVKYCSDQCRGQKNKDSFQNPILELLQKRSKDKTICPSEVLPMELKSDKAMMEKVRQSARLLAHAGKIEITQGGQVVSPDNFKGPIRLRLKR